MSVLAGLSALVVPDAGPARELAWLGAGGAVLLLALGMMAGSSGPVHAAVALLGAIFLLRRDLRLLLAPPYGAGLLLMEDLAVQAIELRGVARVTSEVIAARTGAALMAAAVGACAAGAAAISVTVAPARSVGLTAVGVFVAVAAFAAIVLLARRRYGSRAAEEPPSAPPQGR